MILFLTVFSLWVALLFPPVAYYVWMMKNRGPPSIRTDSNYQPYVSLIVATYNEAVVISDKLENIQKLEYPENKLQVIVVDSASNDGTLDVCNGFLAKTRFRFPIKLVSEAERLGKSHALNFALKYADGEIIATSDSDSFWESDALRKAASYFSDKSVGVVTGREELTNVTRNVHTLSEGVYKGFFNTFRLGESNIHSTLFIQGELALYRRTVFNEFEDRPGYPDDNGTALNVISSGYRCIYAPEAVFHDIAPFSFKGRWQWKSRRAEHLIACVVQSLKLKLKRNLPLSWRVVFFNFYVHVVSPLLLIITLLATVVIYIIDFRSIWFLPIFLVPFLLKKPRVFSFSYLTSNLALIKGLSMQFTKKRKSIWTKIDEMRDKS